MIVCGSHQVAAVFHFVLGVVEQLIKQFLQRRPFCTTPSVAHSRAFAITLEHAVRIAIHVFYIECRMG